MLLTDSWFELLTADWFDLLTDGCWHRLWLRWAGHIFCFLRFLRRLLLAHAFLVVQRSEMIA